MTVISLHNRYIKKGIYFNYYVVDLVQREIKYITVSPLLQPVLYRIMVLNTQNAAWAISGSPFQLIRATVSRKTKLDRQTLYTIEFRID